jgi:hypothetical protein
LDSRLAGRRKRDDIKATVGFKKFGEATGTQPKSLIRMYKSRGSQTFPVVLEAASLHYAAL